MNFPHLSSLLYARPLQVSFIAHTDAFLILVLKMLSICSVNTCKLQHYLLLSVYWTGGGGGGTTTPPHQPKTNSLFEWEDWIECVQSGREQNNYLPKAGKLNAYNNKVLEGFKEINSDTGFFLPKEHAHRVWKTVHSQFYWALKLVWFYFFMYHCQYVLVMHHFSAQPCSKKKWLH